MLKEYLTQKNIIFKQSIPLAAYSTFKIGGIASIGIFPSSESELCDVLSYLESMKEKYCVIGRGSNILFGDGNIDKAFVFTEKLAHADFDKNTVRVSAGYPITSLAREAAKRSLSGLEFAYGIPGSLGGAVFMNAGAYGSEISDTVVSVRAYCARDGVLRTYTKDECKFAYRSTVFQNSPDLTVIGATLALEKLDSNESILSKMKANMAARTEKQPLELPNAGSVFKRPQGNFAGKLIEDSGLKGARIGKAEVSEKHAGFIVNLGGATCADVEALIEHIKRTVFDKHGVMLHTEIRIIK